MVKVILIAFLFLLNFSSCSPSKNEIGQKELMGWIWLSDHHTNDYHFIFNKLKEYGFDGVLLSASPQRTKEIIPTAEKYNIQVHSWKWIMNSVNIDLLRKNPNWASVNRLGVSTLESPPYVSYYRFLCPALPEVREYIYDNIDDYLEIDGLRGLSLDYCRYVDVILPEKLWEKYGIVQDKEYPEWDYGYHSYLINLFKDKYGYDPRVLENPAIDSQWVQFRELQVNEIAWEIARMTRTSGKQISASPFPTPSLARKHVRQDWGSWDLDMVFPMIYSSFYKEGGESWFLQCIEECQESMSDKNTLVFPGIFAEGHRGNEFSMAKALKITLESGSTGFAIFSYESLNEEEWSIIKSFTHKYRK
jgi:uncharacterized lipoprotein YddW (UPF0748 family)